MPARANKTAEEHTPESVNTGKAPDVEFRLGPVRAALWSEERTGDFGNFIAHNVKLERSWRDSNDGWQQQSITLSRTEVADAIAVLQRIQFGMMSARVPNES